MTFLLLAIVILLAAILITLLAGRKIASIVLGGILLLFVAIHVLHDLFGTSGVEIAFGLVAVLLFGLMFYAWWAEKRDKEQSSKPKPLSEVERLDGDTLDRAIWNRERDLK